MGRISEEKKKKKKRKKRKRKRKKKKKKIREAKELEYAGALAGKKFVRHCFSNDL